MGVEIQLLLGRDSYGLFVEVQAAELKRALSNIIDNAVEAIKGAGKVTVRIATEGSQIIRSVSDQGEGIPDELQSRIGERGFTHGKPAGNGLGLYHARQTVESAGGALGIRSALGVGTTIDIRLPRAAAPGWFIEKIALPAAGSVLILDDDKTIHATWDQVLAASLQGGVNVLHFTRARPLHEWLSQHRDSTFMALIDYELLGEELTGLYIIEQEKISQHAVLVTSRFAEPAVIHRACELGLKILPKGLVGLVPIITDSTAQRAPAETPAPGWRVVVIDDDEMIAWAWRKQQKRLGIVELQVFASMEACDAAAVKYEMFDLAFVDLHIKETAWPIAKTLRYLKERAVKRVLIASGSDEAEASRQDADGIVAEKIPEDLQRCFNPIA